MRPVHLSILFGLAAGAPSAQVAWFNPNPSTAPSNRKYTVMVWDSVRERVVLFGGQEDLATYHNDTWEWDGTRWTELHPAHRPPAREDHQMCFDSTRGRVVLFGGHDVNVRFLNDTWEWDGTDWREMAPATVPFARAYGAMVYDPVRRISVIFGGVDSSIREVAETWEWDGVNWRARFPIRDPGRRSEVAMCWDPVRQRVVLYGGQATGVGWYHDQWEYDGGTWTDVTTSPPGPGLSDMRMVFDVNRGRLVIFGGRSMPGNLTWERVGNVWEQRDVPAPFPPGRNAHTMAYDPVRGEAVLFGGYDGINRMADTWLYRPVAPASVAVEFGTGCGGSPPVLALEPGQRAWIGDTLRWHLQANVHTAALALGATRDSFNGVPLPFDLSRFGMPGCALWVAPDVLAPMQPEVTGCVLSTPIPFVHGLAGASLFLQALVVDPAANAAGLTTTAGMQLRLGAR